MLEVFSKEIYVGVEVPEDTTTDEFRAAMDALLPGRWALQHRPKSMLAEYDPAPTVQIEAPWGWIPAIKGDIVMVDESGKASVVPKFHLTSLRLRRRRIDDLIKEKTS